MQRAGEGLGCGTWPIYTVSGSGGELETSLVVARHTLTPSRPRNCRVPGLQTPDGAGLRQDNAGAQGEDVSTA